MSFKSTILVYKFFIFSSVFMHGMCDIKSDLKQKAIDIKNKGKELYGNVTKPATKEWQYQLEDRLAYSRGDKWKLAEVSKQWSEYYDCLVRRATTLPTENRLSAHSHMIYVGMKLTIDCTMCLSPEGRKEYEWWYSENIESPSFSPLEPGDSAVVEPAGALTVYGVTAADAGVYLCRLGASNGSRVYVEVVDDEEKYTVVKTDKSKLGAWPRADTELGGALRARSRRAPWSACSACGRVGRRRRLAVCCVTLADTTYGDETVDAVSSKNEIVEISAETTALLKAFPEGIPCRSRLLPRYLRDEPRISYRPNEIMIGLCKVPCRENVLFEVRTGDGRVVEQANNSAGIYSMLQTPPPQPPPPARDILFLYRLQTVRILCPGSLFTDAPVKWKIGSLDVIPRVIDKESGGRIYVSARDQLVISSLRLTDSNLYSCWQQGKLAGTVRVLVAEGHTLHYDRHLTLLALAVVAAVALRLATRTLRNKQRNIILR